MTNFICATLIITNLTSYPWNDRDEIILKTAEKRCPIIYPKSPCLKSFIKKGKNKYGIICTKESK